MLFRGLVNVYKAAEAATALEMVFRDVAKATYIDLEKPDIIARELVQKAWDANKTIFSGKLGPRPHKLTVCICALAHAANEVEVGSGLYILVTQSLHRFIVDLQNNGFAYDFKSVDHTLQEKAFTLAQEKAKEFEVLFEASGLKKHYDQFTEQEP